MPSQFFHQAGLGLGIRFGFGFASGRVSGLTSGFVSGFKSTFATTTGAASGFWAWARACFRNKAPCRPWAHGAGCRTWRYATGALATGVTGRTSTPELADGRATARLGGGCAAPAPPRSDWGAPRLLQAARWSR